MDFSFFMTIERILTAREEAAVLRPILCIFFAVLIETSFVISFFHIEQDLFSYVILCDLKVPVPYLERLLCLT